MSETTGLAGLRGNASEFSVSELSAALKRTIEDNFGYVRVRGELSKVNRHTSGHTYVDLKDDRAVLASVIWKGQYARLSVKPEQGMEVIASGRITTFAGQSKYQLVIEELELAGLGALMKLLEERRKKLTAEGLFDPARKKKLPYIPEVIGVVTSPTGAVIRDILHRLADRFPRHVLVWPVAVQGERAANEIARAIKGFNALKAGGAVPRPDVLIVARGGGSFEDLMPFNEESVVRAAAESAIPLISAVGHETDTTLIDYAADLRAPTPTAAAEHAVPVRAELLAQTLSLTERLVRGEARLSEERRRTLRDLARALPRPEDLVALREQRLDHVGTRLVAALRDHARLSEARLLKAAARLTPRVVAEAIARGDRRLVDLAHRARMAIARRSETAADRLAVLAKRLAAPSYRAILTREEGRMADLAHRARLAVTRRRETAGERLSTLAKLLETLSHRATLARGFALVRAADGTLRRTASSVVAGEPLALHFADGTKAAHADGGEGAPSSAPARKRGGKTSQGSLF
ncbi:MAG: exodeoxyribonuclease VII large subunit [Alphaproteobacteria bacterium]|nr:exodeoxyribonuclease VII large subunit [Alphaproteobacteria bacterium]